MGPTWKHAGLIGKVGITSSQTLQRTGRRLYPLYFAAVMSSDVVKMLMSACNRRLAGRYWELLPSGDPPVAFDGRSDLY